jgi:hypothetical protein
LISSSLLSFSSKSWEATCFFLTIPSIYLLHLLDFSHNTGTEKSLFDHLRLPFLYSLLLIEGICLLMLSEEKNFKKSAFVIIISVLVTFGAVLCGYLYELVMNSRLSKIFATLTTASLFIILAVVAVDAKTKKNEELLKICFFLAALIPVMLTSSSIYVRVEISSELKNSIFLAIWTLLYVPSMSLASRNSENSEKVLRNLVNFSFGGVGCYFLIFETISRLQQTTARDLKNIFILCFWVIPLGSLTCLSLAGASTGPLLFLLFFSITFSIVLAIFYLPGRFLFQLSLKISAKSSEEVQWFESRLVLLFSSLWKLVYIFSLCFLTRRLYFSTSQETSNSWINSQALLALISAMIHSVLLENINFFVVEAGHKYPSIRKISLVSQIIPSLLRETFVPVKRRWQKRIFFFFIVVESVTLSCFAVSKTVYFLTVFNLVTAFLFIVAFETKLKTWDRGSKISAEFLVFVWTCIYVPFVCGSSVIYKANGDGEIDETSSLMVFFIVVSVCVQMGLSSAELYEKISSKRFVYMNLFLKSKGFSLNYRNLVIEDYRNGNFENFEIIEKGNGGFEQYLKEHFIVVCEKCRVGEDHDLPRLFYEFKHFVFFRKILLQPEEFHRGKKIVKKSQVQENLEGNLNDEVIHHHKFSITNDKLLSYRELFRLRPEDDTVKKFNFVNALSGVYRHKIDKQEIKRDDFFMIFLKVTHNVSMQVVQKFDEDFILKVLKGIAELIHGEVTQKTLLLVEKEILTRDFNHETERKKEKEGNTLGSLTEKASKMYLNINVNVKNILDELIPYSLLSLQVPVNNNEKSSIRDFLDELSKDPDDFTGDSIESINTSIQLLFFASIFNMYSLTSVALSGEINWLQSKLSLSTGIIPSESSWLVSVIFSFSLIFLLFFLTLTMICLIKYKKVNSKLIQFGKSFMIIIASGMLVENLIFLLSNLICESTNGKLHIQNNEDIECLSKNHVILLSISILSFIAYFFLVQVFYPSFHKLSTRVENYFNIEVHCKVIYSAIASCISNKLLGLKLVLCLVLAIALVFYAFVRIRTGKGNVEKFRSDMKEYLVVVWIYIWALVLYHDAAKTYGFIVLVVTVVF